MGKGFITDDTPCATCGPDGAVGYLDRWIGNANPSYEHAITYFEGVMQGYGLDRVEVHRFQWNTAWAVNICGYKDGSVYPDEWLIFGARIEDDILVTKDGNENLTKKVPSDPNEIESLMS